MRRVAPMPYNAAGLAALLMGRERWCYACLAEKCGVTREALILDLARVATVLKVVQQPGTPCQSCGIVGTVWAVVDR